MFLVLLENVIVHVLKVASFAYDSCLRSIITVICVKRKARQIHRCVLLFSIVNTLKFVRIQ